MEEIGKISPLEVDFQIITDPTEKYETLIDYLLSYLSTGDLTGRIKNIQMLEADFNIQFFQQRMLELEKECLLAKLARKQEYDAAIEQAISQLPNQIQKSQSPTTGLSVPEIEALKKENEKQYREQLEQETAKVKQEFNQKREEDEQRINEMYELALKISEVEISKAQKLYEEGDINDSFSR